MIMKLQLNMKKQYQNIHQDQQQQQHNNITTINNHQQQQHSRINLDHVKIIAFILIVLISCIFFTGFRTPSHQGNDGVKKTIRQQKIKHKKQQKLLLQLLHNYHENEAKQVSKQLHDKIKSTRYYDLFAFLGSLPGYTPFKDIQYLGDPNNQIVLQLASIHQKQINFSRPLINLTSSNDQIQLTINKMMQNYGKKLKKLKDQNLMPLQIQKLANFFKQLSVGDNKKQYLQAQFYRYDKLYEIGKYGSQLPLCIVVVGKNNEREVQRLLKSIQYQNYTNYKIAYVDDASTDSTLQTLFKYLANSDKYYEDEGLMRPVHFQQKITIVTQKYQRNALYNRNLGVLKYCEQNDIVIDIDADDYIIGRQVFQLVNTIYQSGYQYNGKTEELWCAYFGNIADYIDGPLAALYGQIDPQILQNNTYRMKGKWRTTQLRTYRKQLYIKVDKKQFIDQNALKQGQFYVQSYDVFMQVPMVEMSGPQHIRILDQFLYFYTGSPSKTDFVQSEYSNKVAKTLMPYKKLQRLSDDAQRYMEIPQSQSDILKQLTIKRENYTSQVKEKLTKLKQQIQSQYNKQREQNLKI